MMENRRYEEVHGQEKEATDAFFNDSTIPSFPSANNMSSRNSMSNRPQGSNGTPKNIVCLNDSRLRPGSKASELCGHMDAHIVENESNFTLNQVQRFVALIREHVNKSAPSFHTFFDVHEFSKPVTGGMIVDRMERNFRFFLYNYLLICTLLFLLCAIFNPTVLILFIICSGVCGFVSHRGQPVKINEALTLSVQQFQGCVATAGTICMLLFAGNVIMMTLFACTFLICIHASLHQGVSYEKIAEFQAEQQAQDAV